MKQTKTFYCSIDDNLGSVVLPFVATIVVLDVALIVATIEFAMGRFVAR